MDCLFCKIISGEIPSYKIWEDEEHLAFLGIFPNTPGMTVVVPKKHYSGYVFDMPEEALARFMQATQKVAQLLDEKLGVERTGVIIEGTEIDHAHVKLYPLWGYKHGEKKETSAGEDAKPAPKPKFFKEYQGYLTSWEGPAADQKDLEEMHKKITG